MSATISSHGHARRKGGCKFFRFFFIVFQLLLLLTLLQLAFNNDPTRGLNTYPTFLEARGHFLNSVASFSVMKPVDPNIASSNYLSTSKLTSRDKNFLRYFIDDYIAFHKRNRRNATRRLIFTPLRTGIGDRMGCLIFAYWAAVLSRRVFLVDWNYPFPLQEFLTEANGLEIFLDEGQIGREATVGNLTRLGNKPSSLKTYERVLTSDTETVIMATNKIPHSFSENGTIQLIPSSMSLGHVNHMRLDRNFHRAILHHVLTLSDRMRRDEEVFLQRMGLSGESMFERRRPRTGTNWAMQPFLKPRKPYIAVHARIGTGVGENRAKRFRNISENVKLAASCLASRAVRLSFLGGSPALPIYLATDTPAFRDVFRKIVRAYSNGRVDVISGSWSVQHSNRLPANEHKESRDENWEAMWGSYMDLVLLGHGQHILALYSSFPRLASAIGNAETLTELKNQLCFSS